MKVAYVIPFDLSRHSALWARLIERLECWRGHDVEAVIIVCLPRDSRLSRGDIPAPHRLVPIARSSSAIASFSVSRVLSHFEVDVVYMRYGLPYPGLVQVARRWPTVLEIHADDRVESEFRPWRYRVVSTMFRRALLDMARGAVFVDPDLMHSQSFARIDGPTEFISNGVKIDPNVAYGGGRSREWVTPRLFMAIGSPEPWQGFEKLVSLARLCPNFDFIVAGPVTEVEGLPSNMILRGVLDTASIEATLQRMDIGIGNLGLELVSRRRPSPLKVREYIRAGLPCVIAHDDPDISDDEPSVLQLGYGFSPSAEVARRLEQFVLDRLGRYCSRELALSVSLEQKEARRLALLGTALRSEG